MILLLIYLQFLSKYLYIFLLSNIQEPEPEIKKY